MTDIHATILELVEDGIMDADYALRCCLNWMDNQNIQDMVNNMPDFEGYGLQEGEGDEDDDEETVDGTQYRMVVENDTPDAYHARIHAIDSDGDDVFPAQFEVTTEMYTTLPDTDWDNVEEATDFFLTSQGLPFADHYLEETDEVVWTES